jgi:hypothetical protein
MDNINTIHDEGSVIVLDKDGYSKSHLIVTLNNGAWIIEYVDAGLVKDVIRLDA